LEQVTHICLPGPSFEWPSPRPEDRVIGVNVAIAKMERCDVFVALGRPTDRVLASILGHLFLMNPLIVSMGEAAAAWRKADYSVKDWPQMTPGWLERAYSGQHFSMFTAISYAASTSDGPIKLWGCDLEGDRYCTGQSPHGSHWLERRRWPAEFRNLKRIHAAALANQVDLRIHGRVAHRLPGA